MHIYSMQLDSIKVGGAIAVKPAFLFSRRNLDSGTTDKPDITELKNSIRVSKNYFSKVLTGLEALHLMLW